MKTIGKLLGITQFPFTLENKTKTGKIKYEENSNNLWFIEKYDINNNLIYTEDSTGKWLKFEYDDKNNCIHYENSIGYWFKREYDINNNYIYEKISNGYWFKCEYDENNNKIYYENSIKGVVFDKRNKKEIKIDDIFDRAIKLSEKAELLRPNLQIVENILLKLIEEIGELSCGILKLKQYKVNNDCSDDIINNNKEEIIDCIICCLNIVYKLGISKEEFIEIANKKLDKWDMVHLTK